MSYLLQTKEHVDAGNRHAEADDVVVSGDLRAAYRIAKDGSRRRIKDKSQLAVIVQRVRQHLADEALREAEAKEQAAAERLQASQVADTLSIEQRPKLSPGTLALLVGGMSMLTGGPLLPRPRR